MLIKWNGSEFEGKKGATIFVGTFIFVLTFKKVLFVKKPEFEVVCASF